MYVVITGTSRGIGLELTKVALSLGHQVLAIARHPDASPELIELKKNMKQMTILPLDLIDPRAHEIIAESVSHWPQVDLIINNAGILEKDETIEQFEKSFLINSIKPFFITQALLDKLKKSPKPISLQITSTMGSIMDNTSGDAYSYRASKAALNMIFKSLSIDQSWLISLLVHPGWVQTNMGGKSAPITPAESAQGIWRLIGSTEITQSGSFKNYLGKTLPW